METLSYVFSEVENSQFTEQSKFYIHGASSELAIIFRLISGSCVCFNKHSEENADLDVNYFFGDLQLNESRDLNFLNNFEEGLLFDDYERFVKSYGVRNRKFYKSLLNEITGAIFNEWHGRHTASFVHIYRAYEHISYAFPMIYSSKTDDYVGTFENLRKWLAGGSDKNVGELRFHKSFIQSLFNGSTELSSTVDIDIATRAELKEGIFNSLVTKVLDWKEGEYTPSTVNPDKIAINFLDFHSFIVNLRNRFFHYSNIHSKNIGMDDIFDSELLFSMINKKAINYIATIFHAIVRRKIEYVT